MGIIFWKVRPWWDQKKIHASPDLAGKGYTVMTTSHITLHHRIRTLIDILVIPQPPFSPNFSRWTFSLTENFPERKLLWDFRDNRNYPKKCNEHTEDRIGWRLPDVTKSGNNGSIDVRCFEELFWRGLTLTLKKSFVNRKSVLLLFRQTIYFLKLRSWKTWINVCSNCFFF